MNKFERGNARFGSKNNDFSAFFEEGLKPDSKEKKEREKEIRDSENLLSDAYDKKSKYAKTPAEGADAFKSWRKAQDQVYAMGNKEFKKGELLSIAKRLALSI